MLLVLFMVSFAGLEWPSQEDITVEDAHPFTGLKELQGCTMSTWLQATFARYLFLVFHGSSTVVAITERRVAAEGASILMDAPDVKDLSLVEWKYIRDTNSNFILQYYAEPKSTTIYPAYQGRVTFYPGNGSILLQGLRETDSGTYTVTVNLMQDKARTTHLEVIKPVPEPELQSTSDLAGSNIELVCSMVTVGPVDSISWRKDGHPLSTKMSYLLSGDSTKLQIMNADKLDCGTYSCNVSNVISWEEATLTLVVTGLTPLLQRAQRMVVVVLILIPVSTISFVIQLCQQGLGEEVMKCIRLFTYGLLCISSALLFVTSIIWMWEKGPSGPYILLGLFFFTATVATGLTTATQVCKRTTPVCFKEQRCCRVIQNSTAPTTLIVNLLFATFFLYNIHQLHERGCTEAVDLKITFVSAALLILTLLLLLLLHLWYTRKKQKNMMKPQHTTHNPQAMDTLVNKENRRQRQELE